MSKILAIIGAGELGQQIAHLAITDNHYERVVFFDDVLWSNPVSNIPILGPTEKIIEKFQEGFFDELVIGIGYKHLLEKKKIFEKFSGKIPFGKIIHSTSWIDKTATIEDGCIIYPHAVVDKNVIIQNNTLLNLGVIISHDSVVGKHSFLAPRVTFSGFVKVEECCFIGTNTTVVDAISIRSYVQTGAGAIVTKNITESGLYVGIPAKKIKN